MGPKRSRSRTGSRNKKRFCLQHVTSSCYLFCVLFLPFSFASKQCQQVAVLSQTVDDASDNNGDATAAIDGAKAESIAASLFKNLDILHKDITSSEDTPCVCSICFCASCPTTIIYFP